MIRQAETSTQSTPDRSPDHTAAAVEIRAFLVAMLERGQGADAIDFMLDLLEQLRKDNNHQAMRIADLLRNRFGRSSEKVTREQLNLFLTAMPRKEAANDEPRLSDGEDELPPLTELPKPDVEAKQPRERTGRNKLPDDLPRKTVRRDPEPELLVCSVCAKLKCRIGTESSQLLEWVPGHFEVHVERRGKFACKNGCEGVVVAPPADKPIDKGLPGPGLLARIVTGKYADHAPIYRQQRIFKRAGVVLAYSTMLSWVGAVVTALKPVYRELIASVLAAAVLGVDDTHIRVLIKGGKGVKRGHLWAYVGYEECQARRVVFDYTPNWKGDGPCRFIGERRGYIQADGYKGLERLFAGERPQAIKVGCPAHARRKFEKALKADDPRAAVAIELFQYIYQVEKLAKSRGGSPAVRQALRNEYSRPAMHRLGKWIAAVHPHVEPRSPLGKALTYAINQWPSLERFLDDGHLPIDNNAVEREIRPIVVGRKNWLFAGSDEGGDRAAVMYSLIWLRACLPMSSPRRGCATCW